MTTKMSPKSNVLSLEEARLARDVRLARAFEELETMIHDVDQMSAIALDRVCDANEKIDRSETDEDRDLAIFAVRQLRRMITGLREECRRLWGGGRGAEVKITSGTERKRPPQRAASLLPRAQTALVPGTMQR